MLRKITKLARKYTSIGLQKTTKYWYPQLFSSDDNILLPVSCFTRGDSILITWKMEDSKGLARSIREVRDQISQTMQLKYDLERTYTIFLVPEYSVYKTFGKRKIKKALKEDWQGITEFPEGRPCILWRSVLEIPKGVLYASVGAIGKILYLGREYGNKRDY